MNENAFLKLLSEESYALIKFNEVSGRYIINENLEKVMKDLPDYFGVEEIGKSELGKPIYRIRVGTGDIKILAWSQMHGNEGTTTKALFDLFNAFKLNAKNEHLAKIYNNCTLYIIPILNPDGAAAYTRVNANKVDLNRDMQHLSQKESRLLRRQYEEVCPAYCLNLHDQRTIFSAGEYPRTATLSFLTPSNDETRSVDESRKISMTLIAKIARDLAKDLPGQIGRYDDAFNINCAGDTFQFLKTPTILFEAGHFAMDYEREITRKFVYKALISCLAEISNKKIATNRYEDYFKIPENQKLFNDVIVRNARIGANTVDVSIQFKEVLDDEKVEFVPVLEKIGKKLSNYGHREINAGGEELKLPDDAKIIENVIVNKIIINNTLLEVKYG